MSLSSRPLLIASEDFAEQLPAGKVAEAIMRGLRAAGLPEPDLCPLPGAKTSGSPDIKGVLDALGFDGRMRAARALIVASRVLHERTLDGSMAFEVATRARQAGVPAYAVTAENRLNAFDARILDLQLILEGADSRSLREAGRKLAKTAFAVSKR